MTSTAERRAAHKDARRSPVPDRTPLPGTKRKKKKHAKPYHVIGLSLFKKGESVFHQARNQHEAEAWISKQQRSIFIPEDPVLKEKSLKIKRWADSLRWIDTRST